MPPDISRGRVASEPLYEFEDLNGLAAVLSL
jgi:hypothetical protein